MTNDYRRDIEELVKKQQTEIRCKGIEQWEKELTKKQQTDIFRYKGKDFTFEQLKKELAKQPMPPPNAKDKVWHEKPLETETETIIFAHDNIDGKRCPECDKELIPEKIVWYINKGFRHMIYDPETGTMLKPLIICSIYGFCSEECKKSRLPFIEKAITDARNKVFGKVRA